MQGLRCGTSKPPVPEQRQINRLHAEKMKRRKDAAEAKAERKRKRKRKAKHDKACKLARAEGKPQPATPESSEEDEEEASDAKVGNGFVGIYTDTTMIELWYPACG